MACQARCLHWRIQGRGPGVLAPLLLDQNEARSAEKHVFLRPTLPLSQGLDGPPPPLLSEGLGPRLVC